MSRYLVFKFNYYDESGGWNDFVSAHSELNQAVHAAEKYQNGMEYAQIVDLETLKVIEERYLWKDGNMMVTKAELEHLRRQREEQIAEIQRRRGLIA